MILHVNKWVIQPEPLQEHSGIILIVFGIQTKDNAIQLQ